MQVGNFQEVNIDFMPLQFKLLTDDIFTLNEAGDPVLERSLVRELDNIPGVLHLNGGKTYGREHGNNGKLLYRVVPDDMRLPVFLVPYEQKNVGFSKVFDNTYVTFRFLSWDSKHPLGKLTNTIGNVNSLPSFYEYQLYCRSLNTSIQLFNKETVKRVKTMSATMGMGDIINKYENIEDRRGDDWHVFTIDPETSTDFDDGFSIRKLENKNDVMISIYIANVTILLDVLGLWETFSRRVSTIYLPDRKRPMLPTILSDSLCSLQEKNTRFALAMDVCIDTTTGEIKKVSFVNCAIRVFKNYRYNEELLHQDKDYIQLQRVTIKMSYRYKYIKNIRDSHDVVCYLMTLMNYHCACDLLSFKNGIFRSSILCRETANIPEDLDDDVEKFIKIWYSSGASYINAAAVDDNFKLITHELLNMDAYVHITSPIRRLVDLLNMIQFQSNRKMITLSESAYKFYSHWTSANEMEYINNTMRSIKKVQNDCSMLEFYTNNMDKLQDEYNGVMFDRIQRSDASFQYVVYLPELRLNLRINLREEYPEFSKNKFKLYLFEDEENLRRKIRLQFIDNNNDT